MWVPLASQAIRHAQEALPTPSNLDSALYHLGTQPNNMRKSWLTAPMLKLHFGLIASPSSRI
jgi:hypothetical protein